MMSAIVACGSKRSFFEDLPTSPPIASKRFRCYSSTSPIDFSPFSSFSSPSASDHNHNSIDSASALDHLKGVFPDMDEELLERALKECGNDLDSAIKSLNELRLESAARSLDSDAEKHEQSLKDIVTTSGDITPSNNPLPSNNLPTDGSEWVEMLVREMANSSNVDDAKARASRVLEVLEKSICASAGAKAAENFQMENMMLKEQVEALIHENTILKRAVAIQHERQKEYDDRNQELQRLKQLLSQYQEQLRTLEVNNYALNMHLKQAQQSNSIPGRFHPDVF